MSDLNILIFHKIVENEISEWADVNIKLFTQLLKVAKGYNQDIVSVNDWVKNGSGELALSFDDGHISDFEIVLPLLRKNRAHGTFFITPNFVGKKGYMSWKQIRTLSEYGMEIGSHSLTHPFLTTLSTEQLLIELKDSKLQIEQYIDKEVVSFAYPFGDCSMKTHRVAIEAGYTNICTSKPGLCNPKTKTLSRNSVNSSFTADKFEQLFYPSSNAIIRKEAAYYMRYALKRCLGVNNYMKLKDYILL